MTAALVSNNSFLNHGVGGRVKLNLGVILSGRAAIRKSSAINFMQRFAGELPLNYGPTDTAGARHGIMSAMQARWQDDIKDEVDEPESLEQLAAANLDSVIAKLGEPRTRPSSIYFASKELGRLLTAQTRELLDFFADGIDGESIFYQTKTGNIRIPNPLINLLGATTPGSLPAILPRDAHDHGLLSRLVFVYAGKSEQAVPIPPEISTKEIQLQDDFIERLKKMVRDSKGEVCFADDGLDEYKRLYTYAVPSIEFRLNAYAGRRAIHLAKVSALICLLRGDVPFTISRLDVALAHTILMLTETDMDAAYMGLDKTPAARAYALIREVLESTSDDKNRLTRDVIYGHLSRAGFPEDDMTKIIERLVLGRRLVASGDSISLSTGINGELAALYYKKLEGRL